MFCKLYNNFPNRFLCFKLNRSCDILDFSSSLLMYCARLETAAKLYNCSIRVEIESIQTNQELVYKPKRSTATEREIPHTRTCDVR